MPKLVLRDIEAAGTFIALICQQMFVIRAIAFLLPRWNQKCQFIDALQFSTKYKEEVRTFLKRKKKDTKNEQNDSKNYFYKNGISETC